MVVVIGSGPAAIGAALPLIASGHPVTLLDGGEDLDPSTTEMLSAERKKNIPISSWDQELLQSFKTPFQSSTGGVSEKLVYGSNYPYRTPGFKVQSENLGHLKASQAVAGYSNVWGSAIMPYSPKELSHWPVSLDEAYKKILSELPYLGRNDKLNTLLPLHTENWVDFPLSDQMRKIENKLEHSEPTLSRLGVSWGRARLAVDPRCESCGLCMYGCPKDYIYSTRHHLQKWQGRQGFQHLQGHLVRSIQETPNGVILRGKRKSSSETFELRADATFIAAGPLATLNLLHQLDSKSFHSFQLKVSEYFMAPLFQWRWGRLEDKLKTQTLSQIFFECADPEISDHLIHLQLYGYNDLYDQVIGRKFGPMAFLAKPLTQTIASRMLAIQGYLHSDDSSHIKVNMIDDHHMQLIGHQNPKAIGSVQATLKKIGQISRLFGATPLTFLASHGKPGDGRHVGSALPMSVAPSAGQSDLLGRPEGLRRIHLVDATVLPDLPATTITLSVMANAYRIAKEYLESSL